jgi:hypothetical protein
LSVASGNLTSLIGTAPDLAPTQTGHLYRQNVAGWARYFLGLDGATANQGWSTSSTLLNLASGQSCAVVCWAAVQIPASATRILFAENGANFVGISAPAGFMRIQNNGVLINGTVPYSGITVVQQLVWYRNGTTNVSGAFSNFDSVLNAHSEEIQGAVPRGLGVQNTGNLPPVARICKFSWYIGAAAEQNWSTYFARIRGEA